MKTSKSLGVIVFISAFFVSINPARANIFSKPIDLSKPFICKDISPTPMHITDKGLIVSGVLYPLYNSNSSSTPVLTNTIFRSLDNLEEIDIIQNSDNGKVNVSYMKFRINPDQLINDESIENNKVFEKGSFDAVNPGPTYYSKNQGCEQ
ncbi:MAG TPA: hypothetical protein VH187_00360 [Scandinavium sp.]|jgi:hypothetical protein|uniref:hypothetical protein n=1 Tax=Scandinavium sp. TaxID=2830653 RepID=UPI002E32E286|nr:hypothetical protein [Scandinavium sp.]HEX4499612.1 hypothetical protein [Scandinavium sp.]